MTSATTYDAAQQLDDGTVVRLRTARPTDVDGVVAMCGRLTPRTVHARFHGLVELGRERAVSLIEGDPDRGMSLVATVGEGADERVVGVATVERFPEDASTAELAVLVEDRHQGRGIGTALCRHLLGIRWAAGITTVVGDVLSSNTRMLGLLRDLGLTVRRRHDGDVIHTTFGIPS